jgi:uncharacterized membrane protein YedE/YeeE
MLHSLLYEPWPWFIAGPAIGIIYFALYFVGKRFGVSGTYRTTCSMLGAGKFSNYFKIKWKDDIWNLVFVVGMVIGGYLAGVVFPNEAGVDLSDATIASLEEMGITSFKETMIPTEIFSWENLFSIQGLIFIVIGGLLVGFGTRYADGCTSGHAITGLANLEFSSLVAVIGFFIGGVFTTFFLIPIIMNL